MIFFGKLYIKIVTCCQPYIGDVLVLWLGREHDFVSDELYLMRILCQYCFLV